MVDFTKKFVKAHFDYGIPHASASLAYYLMFSFFPMLIFANSVLGLINLNISNVEESLHFLPQSVTTLIVEYYMYLSTSENLIPLFVGLVLVLYSFTRFINSLFRTINRIYGIEKPKRSLVSSMFFTVALMISVYLVVFLVILGGFIFGYITKIFVFSSDFIILLTLARYLVSVGYFFLVILLMYRFITRIDITIKQCLPGAIYAIIGIFILSAVFSIYVNYFSNYSIIYGSLSAIMLLMLWLYLLGVVIIQGSVINKILNDKKTEG